MVINSLCLQEFYSEYIRRSLTTHSSRLCRLLYTLNPRKFRACEYLVNYHAKAPYPIHLTPPYILWVSVMLARGQDHHLQ